MLISELGINFPGVDPEDYISSWHIQQIINPLKNYGIYFEYDTFTVHRSISYSYTKLYERNNFGIYEMLAGGADETVCQTEIDAKYIKRIYLSNGLISFSSSLSEDGGKKLDSITFIPLFGSNRKFRFEVTLRCDTP